MGWFCLLDTCVYVINAGEYFERIHIFRGFKHSTFVSRNDFATSGWWQRWVTSYPNIPTLIGGVKTIVFICFLYIIIVVFIYSVYLDMKTIVLVSRCCNFILHARSTVQTVHPTPKSSQRQGEQCTCCAVVLRDTLM